MILRRKLSINLIKIIIIIMQIQYYKKLTNSKIYKFNYAIKLINLVNFTTALLELMTEVYYSDL